MESGDIEVDEDDPSSLDDSNLQSKSEDPQMTSNKSQVCVKHVHSEHVHVHYQLLKLVTPSILYDSLSA